MRNTPFVIMLVGGGRRLELAQRFEAAGFAVLAYESEENTPVSCYFPAIIGKKWKDKGFAADLIEKMTKYNVGWCLPLQDEGACEVAHSTALGITSNYYTNRTCFDKKLFADFIEHNFPNYWPEADNYPTIRKPRFGFGSKDIKIINNSQEEVPFEDFENYTENYIYQRFIKGQEFTVDSYVDLNCTCVGCVPRKRLRVADGEVVDSLTYRDEELEDLTRQIVLKLGIIGPACVQFIQEEQTEKFYVLECNARFGGGSTLSCQAGFDQVDMIREEYFLGNELDYDRYKWRENVLMRRTFKDNYFNL